MRNFFDKLFDKLIEYFFSLLFFLIPLIVFPKTSELFEFNKMVLTYILTSLLVFSWFCKMIIEKRIIFRKTLLDIPFLIFLATQLLSTIISIDKRVSILGYYSRFHGGLLSSISYSLLYWTFVSNFDREKTLKSLKFFLSSLIIVSVWAIFEHFGKSFSCLIFPGFGTFDASCWVQDVQTRVFATLGQPNWLASFIVASTPITMAFILSSSSNKKMNYLKNLTFYLLLLTLFFLTLLYTKSRSGFLAFIGLDATFFLGLIFLRHKANYLLKNFLPMQILFLILILLVGTPWTPKISDIYSKKEAINQPQNKALVTQLEKGGTESGEIRKIVWKGAIEIWKNYPILGSGVETFAFSYYKFRPAEHNLVSEWDYLYNKAHNEYLNFLATTGIVGFGGYLILIIFAITAFIKIFFLLTKNHTEQNLKFSFLFAKQEKLKPNLLVLALLSGFVSILITNFFGFSVVAVAIQFFLYPAIAETLTLKPKKNLGIQEKLLIYQKIGIAASFLVLSVVILNIGKYWYADYLYAKAKTENETGDFVKAENTLTKLIQLSPNEPLYWDELANNSTDIAVLLSQEKDEDKIKKANIYKNLAVEETKNATYLSPSNVNLKRNQAVYFIKLSTLDEKLLLEAVKTLEDATFLAPTDAKLYYNLSIAYLRTGDYQKAINIMQKTIDLKPNYREARFALALMYIDEKKIDLAKAELEYILKNLNPNDEAAKRELDELTK